MRDQGQIWPEISFGDKRWSWNSTSHLKACSLLRQKGTEEGRSWSKGKKCMLLHNYSSLFSLPFTVHNGIKQYRGWIKARYWLVFLLILACFLYPKAQRLSWSLFLERDLLGCKFLTAAWLSVDIWEFMVSQQGTVAPWVSKQPWCTRVESKTRAS